MYMGEPLRRTLECKHGLNYGMRLFSFSFYFSFIFLCTGEWGGGFLDDELTPQNGIFKICVSFDQKEGWHFLCDISS